MQFNNFFVCRVNRLCTQCHHIYLLQLVPFPSFKLFRSVRSVFQVDLPYQLVLSIRCWVFGARHHHVNDWWRENGFCLLFLFFFLFLMFEDQINCPSFISPRPHTHRTTPIGEQVKYDARFCNYCHLTKRVLTVFIKIQQNSFPFLASPFQNILPTISMQYGQVSFENTWK